MSTLPLGGRTIEMLLAEIELQLSDAGLDDDPMAELRDRLNEMTEDRAHCETCTCELRVTLPDGCVCDPGEWAYKVTPICAEYVEPGNCGTCEHDMECHAKVTP